MTDSQNLLAEYGRNGSDAAFRELVARFVDLVYSTALRLVDGDTHRAEDMTQTVFVNLARKARTLQADVRLGGWLHRDTYFVATTVMRGERRRQTRERQAVEMNTLEDHSEADFSQVAPLLDEAINELGEADRTAILLRFFEQQDFRAVGQALGSGEDAARMRVTRALDKLHTLLTHRGAALSAAALGTALATEAVTAAPAGLAASVAGAVLASAAAGGGTTATLVKVMTMTKLKLGLTALVIAGAATTLVIQHQSQTKLREENEPFRQQNAQLKADNESLSGSSEKCLPGRSC
jgi:RNA polymerase sigma factor (sigma-70 family)